MLHDLVNEAAIYGGFCLCKIFDSRTAGAVVVFLGEEIPFVVITAVVLRKIRGGDPQLPRWINRRFFIITLLVGSAGFVVELAASAYLRPPSAGHGSIMPVRRRPERGRWHALPRGGGEDKTSPDPTGRHR